MLSSCFDLALRCASDWHRTQVRKGTPIPYISHLLGVTSLVLEHGGDEDAAIAALLHDAVEDAGGAPRRAEIREKFGDTVADIVDHCTDTDVTPKPPWRSRKEAYIARLATASPAALLVSCCDKLHNARTIVADLRSLGTSTWAKFNGGREGTLWYYATITAEFRRCGVPSPLIDELERTVAEMHELVGQGGDRVTE